MNSPLPLLAHLFRLPFTTDRVDFRGQHDETGGNAEWLEARVLLSGTPTFEQPSYAWTAGTDAESGSVVGTARVEYESGQDISYALEGETYGRFAFDTSTGRLTVADSVAHLAGETFSFLVRATDNVSLAEATATLDVTIGRPPVFGAARYELEFGENTGVGVALGSVAALDPEGTAVSYSLHGPAAMLFSVDSAGVISTSSAFPNVPAARHVVTVRATDASGLSDDVQLEVFNGDTADLPSVASGTYQLTLSDEQAVGSTVGVIAATDPAGGAVTYSIVDGGLGGATPFAIDAQTGEITLAAEVDYHAQSNLAFWVLAANGYGRASAVHVLVILSDQDSALGAGSWQTALSTQDANGFRFDSDVWGYWEAQENWQDVWTGDLDGDGDDDLVGRAGDGRWRAALSGASGFSDADWGGWSAGATWLDSRSGDFNGDGLLDVAGRSNGNWWISVSNETEMRFNTTHWGSWSASATWKDVRVGDFDGDGNDDIIGRSNGNWWLSRSNGTDFDSPTVWATWSSSELWPSVRVGDFDGDGKDDLVGRATSGTLWVTRKDSAGNTVTAAWGSWATPTVAWDDVHAVDVDNDGDADLIGRDGFDWWVSVADTSDLNNLHFDPPANWATWSSTNGGAFESVVTGDFDGDSKEDVAGLADGTWYVGLSKAGFFQTENWGDWSTDWDWTNVLSGDFNGDGYSDLVGRAADPNGGTNATPVFSTAWTLSVDEAADVGTAVGSVYARDTGGAGLTYELVAPGSVPFSIDPDGVVHLSAPVDRDAGPDAYTFEVRAVAPGGESDTTFVTVRLLDADDAPNFGGPDRTFLLASVNGLTGDPIGSVAATSARGGTLTYAIVSPAGHVPFEIDPATGELIYGTAAPGIAGAVYDLVVRATDGTETSDHDVRVLLVSNGAAAPRFDEPEGYAFEIEENLSADAPLGRVLAIDPQGAGNDVTYSISSSDPNLPFEIDPLTGELTATGPLDHENGSSYTFDVIATDGGGTYESTSVTVSVNDIDEAPEFDERGYFFAAYEGDTTGTFVGTVSATDPQGDSVTYTIAPGYAGGDFAIDSVTGEITLNSHLDFGGTPGWFPVIAFDSDPNAPGGAHTETVYVEVAIFGPGEQVPRFRNFDEYGGWHYNTFSVTVPEDTAPGDWVADLAALDPQGTPLTYRIEPYDPQEPNTPFSVDSRGRLRVSEELDHEADQGHSFYVIASDGTHESTATVHVYVSDVSEAPEFVNADYENGYYYDEYYFDVREDVGIDAWVGTTLAIDAQGGDVTYAIVADPNYHSNGVPFRVSADGEIITTEELDYEAQSYYSFEVVATDNTDPVDNTAVALVNVNVLNVMELPVITIEAIQPEFDEGDGMVSAFRITAQGDEQAGVITVPVYVVQPATDFHEDSGLAKPVEDFTLVESQVTITLDGNPGTAHSEEIEMNIVQDQLTEPFFRQDLNGERVIVYLGADSSDPQTYTLSKDAEQLVAEVLIVDDDVPVSESVTLYLLDGAAREEGRNLGSFDVVRTGTLNDPVNIQLFVTGSAQIPDSTENPDYELFYADSGAAVQFGSNNRVIVSFAAGEQHKTIIVRPIDDDLAESVEDVRVVIETSLAGEEYEIQGEEIAIEIVDNDYEIGVRSHDRGVKEDEPLDLTDTNPGGDRLAGFEFFLEGLGDTPGGDGYYGTVEVSFAIEGDAKLGTDFEVIGMEDGFEGSLTMNSDGLSGKLLLGRRISDTTNEVDSFITGALIIKILDDQDQELTERIELVLKRSDKTPRSYRIKPGAGSDHTRIVDDDVPILEDLGDVKGDLKVTTPDTLYLDQKIIAEEREDEVGIRRSAGEDNIDGRSDRLHGRTDLQISTADLAALDNNAGYRYALRVSDPVLKIYLANGEELTADANGNYLFPDDTDEDGYDTLHFDVEWDEAGGSPDTATLDLVIVDTNGNERATLDNDGITFKPFDHVIIGFVGEKQLPDDPDIGMNEFIQDLYDDGYDAYIFDEDDLYIDWHQTETPDQQSPGTYSVTNEGSFSYFTTYEAVKHRGVKTVSIVGYSHGGGATYQLSYILANYWGNHIDGSTGSMRDSTDAKVVFTAYIDGVRKDLASAEIRRPPETVYHANYWQLSSLLTEPGGSWNPGANHNDWVETGAIGPLFSDGEIYHSNSDGPGIMEFDDLQEDLKERLTQPPEQ